MFNGFVNEMAEFWIKLYLAIFECALPDARPMADGIGPALSTVPGNGGDIFAPLLFYLI